jgi:hypothetical protein
MILTLADHEHVRQVINEDGFENGWYWVDETEQLNGPYRHDYEAVAAVNAYIVTLKPGSNS